MGRFLEQKLSLSLSSSGWGELTSHPAACQLWNSQGEDQRLEQAQGPPPSWPQTHTAPLPVCSFLNQTLGPSSLPRVTSPTSLPHALWRPALSITVLARGIIMDRNADKNAGVERLNNFPKATQPLSAWTRTGWDWAHVSVFRSWVPGAQTGQTQSRRQVLACSLPSLGGCRVRHFPILSPADFSCGALGIQGIGHRSQSPQDYLQCREQSEPAEQAGEGESSRAGRELQPLRQIDLSRDRKFHKDLTEQATFKQSL